ncbi:MAG: Uma2 family endonuclease [Gemmataceae bacterium]|nr:Uma2 family endonuclease [Gemmataceae bacterium]
MTPTATPPAPASYTPAAPPAPTVAPPTAAPTVPPPAAGGWARFKWTVDEYRQLGRLGLFQDVKVMLIDGEIFTMGPAQPPHDYALTATYEYLRAVCPPGHYVRSQLGFDVGTRTAPEPDLAVVPGAFQDYRARTPTTAALVVEIAHTTLATDTTVKAEKYATAGVPEYWVLDVDGRRLFVYRKPEPLPEGLGATAYRSREEYGPDDAVAPLAAPDKPVKVADLLP